MRRFIAVCYFLFCCILVSGQQLFIQRYPKDVYLGSDQNWDFAQDRKGILYVANNDGVLQYDGEKWDLLPLPDRNFVLSLAVDPEDRLFIGSNNELGYFQRDAQEQLSYHSLIGLLPAANRAVKAIYQVLAAGDTIFFKGADFIYVYSKGKMLLFPSKGQSRGLLSLRGQIYSSEEDGLHPYKGRGFGPVDPALIIPGMHIARIRAYGENTDLLLDQRNQVWVYERGAGTANALRLFSREADVYCKGKPIRGLQVLDNGNVALLLDQELLIADREGNLVNRITRDMFGVDMDYARIFQDHHHNLWLSATDNYLFQVVSSSPLSYYDKNDGLQGEIISFGKSEPYRYVGTTKGIFYQERGAAFTRILRTEGETWNFYASRGREYVAHETGVFEVEGAQVRKLIDQPGVHCLLELKDHPGFFLAGTFDDGYWLLQERAGSWHKQRVKGFEKGAENLLQDSAGNIWVNDFGMGIDRLRLNTRLDSFTTVVTYDGRYGLPSGTDNRTFLLNGGELVATTLQGVYCYDPLRDLFGREKALSRSFPRDWDLVSLVEGPESTLYFRSESDQFTQMAGIVHREQNGYSQPQMTPFNKLAIAVHGLRRGDSDPLMIVDTNEVWLGAGERLIVYNPAQKTFYKDPMPMCIDKVWAGDSLVKEGCRGSGSRQTFPFRQNKLRFRFFSTWFEDPEKVEYQYRLEGFEAGWSAWSSNREAVFTNLPEGDYSFDVKARNVYGMVSTAHFFSFHISPPWYRSWWAYLLYIVAAAAALVGLIRINTQRIAAKNRALEKKVEEKSGEILAQAKKLQELNATKDKLFSIISHDLRGPISTMKAVVDLMKNSSMSEEDMRIFSSELSDHLLVTGNLLNNLLFWAKAQMEGIHSASSKVDLAGIVEENYRLFKPGAEFKGVRLLNEWVEEAPVRADRDIVRTVLRNLISNAIKFTAPGGEVLLGGKRLEGEVEVFVKDSGVGLSGEEIAEILQKRGVHKMDTAGQLGAGLGLLLCQELLEVAGSTISIHSVPGAGSCFSFKLPLY